MKDFQTVTAAAGARIGGFFAELRAHLARAQGAGGADIRTDADAGGDGARIARMLRRFFRALAPAAFAALLGSVRLPLYFFVKAFYNKAIGRTAFTECSWIVLLF